MSAPLLIFASAASARRPAPSAPSFSAEKNSTVIITVSGVTKFFRSTS